MEHNTCFNFELFCMSLPYLVVRLFKYMLLNYWIFVALLANPSRTLWLRLQLNYWLIGATLTKTSKTPWLRLQVLISLAKTSTMGNVEYLHWINWWWNNSSYLDKLLCKNLLDYCYRYKEGTHITSRILMILLILSQEFLACLGTVYRYD